MKKESLAKILQLLSEEVAETVDAPVPAVDPVDNPPAAIEADLAVEQKEATPAEKEVPAETAVDNADVYGDNHKEADFVVAGLEGQVAEEEKDEEVDEEAVVEDLEKMDDEQLEASADEVEHLEEQAKVQYLKAKADWLNTKQIRALHESEIIRRKDAKLLQEAAKTKK